MNKPYGHFEIPVANLHTHLAASYWTQSAFDVCSLIGSRRSYAHYIGAVVTYGRQSKDQIFSPIADFNYNNSGENSTLFSLFFLQDEQEIYLTYPMLEISWFPYLNATQSYVLYRQYNGGGWSPAVANHYATGIIKDIQIRE